MSVNGAGLIPMMVVTVVTVIMIKKFKNTFNNLTSFKFRRLKSLIEPNNLDVPDEVMVMVSAPPLDGK